MSLITVTSGPRNARTDPDSGLRFYTWRGVEYPSVTSVRNLAGMPHPLAAWRTNKVIERVLTEKSTLDRMMADGTDPKALATWMRQAMTQERDAAANLGTRVHDAASEKMRLDQVSSDVAPFLLQYLRWMEDSGIEIVLRERQVWNLTVGYAGTFDLIGVMPKTGQYWMIDLKTGKGTYPEHAIQMEAYARCEFIGNDDVIDVEATDILRQVTGRAVLHLRPEGWTFKVIPASEKTWIAFRGLLAFARWTHDNPNLDTLVSATKTGGSQP
jgi:hypothetical protein